MTIFPNNNLPTGSLNWSREVEKAVNNLESTFKSAEINNVTRDAQLQNSYKRLDATLTQLSTTNAAVDQAQSDAITALNTANTANSAAITATNTATTANATAIEALGDATTALEDAVEALQGLASLDEATSTYKINASNVTVGTMSADRISGGTIDGITITGGSLNTTPSDGKSVSISGSSATFLSGGSSVGSIQADGAGRIGVFSTSGIYLSGSTGVFGGSFSSENDVIALGNLTRSGLAGGGTTGASITNGGNFVRTTSSARYKTDIQPLEIDLADLYEVEPKTFKRIEEVEEDSETARIYPGFIAEELAGTSLDKFVFYSKDEQGNPRPEGIHYPELTAALLLAIKDLNARLAALEDKV
jgi:hypothetical protein